MGTLYVNGTNGYTYREDFARCEGIPADKADRHAVATRLRDGRLADTIWAVEWGNEIDQTALHSSIRHAYRRQTRMARALPPGGYCALYAIQVVPAGGWPQDRPLNLTVARRGRRGKAPRNPTKQVI